MVAPAGKAATNNKSSGIDACCNCASGDKIVCGCSCEKVETKDTINDSVAIDGNAKSVDKVIPEKIVTEPEEKVVIPEKMVTEPEEKVTVNVEVVSEELAEDEKVETVCMICRNVVSPDEVVSCNDCKCGTYCSSLCMEKHENHAKYCDIIWRR